MGELGDHEGSLVEIGVPVFDPQFSKEALATDKQRISSMYQSFFGRQDLTFQISVPPQKKRGSA